MSNYWTELNLQEVERALELNEEALTSATDQAEIEAAGKIKEELTERKKDIEIMQSRKQTAEELRSGKVTGKIIDKQGVEKMDNELDIRMRSFQKYIIDGGMRNMNDTEQRALVLSGSAAVLPVEIMNKLISSEKYADLLNRATVFTEPHAGTLYIPI